MDVYLCECGPIIKEAVDLEALAQRLAGLAEVGDIRLYSPAELPASEGGDEDEIELKSVGSLVQDAVVLQGAVAKHGSADSVARTKLYATLCSEEGQAWLTEQLRLRPDHRVVIAACSPREHESTFRRVCEKATVNPYLMTMANVREQCAWVTPDRQQATDKAEVVVRGAIARVTTQEPLETRAIDANSDALVVGSGPAGLTAARLMADAGRQVYLVERSPAVGGAAVRLAEVFPHMECASCVLEPLVDDVLHHPNIKTFSHSDVEQVVGSFGNFTVAVRQHARHVDASGCFGCGACHAVCPVQVPNAFEADLKNRNAIYIPYAGALPNVSLIDEDSCLHFQGDDCHLCVEACPFGNIDLTATDRVEEISVGAVVLATGAVPEIDPAEGSAFQLPQVFATEAFERLLNPSGPTSGALQLRDGRVPRRIAFVHCADPRGEGPELRCSEICCMSMLKYAHLVHQRLPETEVLFAQWDRCTGGKGYREFAVKVRDEANIRELRLTDEDRLEIAGAPDVSAPVKLRIIREDWARETEVDMAVLAPPLTGAATVRALGAELRLDFDSSGFLVEEHDRLRPFATRVEGVLVAGSAQGPKDVQEATAHGAAAAGAMLSALVPGRQLIVDPARAQVDEESCGGCSLCVGVCPYKAIHFSASDRVAEINDLLCRGCGVCAAECPSSAITARHFADAQIFAEIEALAG